MEVATRMHSEALIIWLRARTVSFFDIHSAASSESTAATAASPVVVDLAATQEALKRFVQSYVKGQTVSILTVHGGLTDCVVTLDRRLTTLSLQRAGKADGKRRGIPLEEIAEIYVGNQVEQDFEIELPGMDEYTTTILVDNGQAVGFHFEDLKDRDVFSMCLSMLVDGRRNETSQKKKQDKLHAVRRGGA